MIKYLLLAAAALFLGAGSAEAGFTVIYYSAPEKIYGWCAGYDSNRSHNCASSACAKRGGTACKPVAECGGYGAVALSEKSIEGTGVACAGNANSSRVIAMTACMAASNALCSTDVTFTPNGKTVNGDNEFDRTWLSQLLLNARRLYNGPQTGESNAELVTAIGEFQVKLGRSRTGVLDDELVRRLLDAIGGTQNLARQLKDDGVPKLRKAIADSGATTSRMYASASSPAKAMSVNQDLNARSDAARKLAMATYLSARGTKCTLPAKEARYAEQVEVWEIDCVEGNYMLIVHYGSSIITKR